MRLFAISHLTLFPRVRYEREETFNALNLAVKSGTLQESLQQFVREEIMDGDNSYFCDKCGKKVIHRG